MGSLPLPPLFFFLSQLQSLKCKEVNFLRGPFYFICGGKTEVVTAETSAVEAEGPQEKLEIGPLPLASLSRSSVPSLSGSCRHSVHPRLLVHLLEDFSQGPLFSLITLGQLPASLQLKCTCLVPHPFRPLLWTVG